MIEDAKFRQVGGIDAASRIVIFALIALIARLAEMVRHGDA